MFVTRPQGRGRLLATGRLVIPLLIGELLGLTSCGTGNVRSLAGPNSLPPTAFGSVVWLDGGAWIGVSHRPLQSIEINRRTGDVIVQGIDSLQGWWVSSSDGREFRRQSDLQVDGAAVSRTGDRIAIGMLPDYRAQPPRGPLGHPIMSFALVADSLVQGSGIEVAARGYLPRWNGAGDSLVISRGVPSGGVMIQSASGGSGHLAVEWVTDADWSPTARRLIWADAPADSRGRVRGLIVEFDLDTGRLDTLIASTTSVFRHPQYDPTGTLIAVARQPIDISSPLELWVGQRTNLPGRRLTTYPILDDFSWSPDGRRIVAIRLDPVDYTVSNSAVFVVDVATGASTIIATGDRWK